VSPLWNDKEISATTLQNCFRRVRCAVIGCGSGFDGLEVACWPLVPKFAGSHPARSRRIFRTKKSSARLPSEGKIKLSVQCRSFTACKRFLNVTLKSAFRQNSLTFLTHSSIFRRWVLSRGDTRGDALWRKLERVTQIAQ
jgi:hypothetical protein